MIGGPPDVDEARSSDRYDSFDRWRAQHSRSRLWTEQDWFRTPQPLYRCSVHTQRDWPRWEGFPASKSRTQATTGWTQSEIASKYEAYDIEKEFKSLFERTNRHTWTRSRTGAWFTSSDLSDTVAANNVCFMRKTRMQQSPNPNQSDGG
jgi:hypothetical protein